MTIKEKENRRKSALAYYHRNKEIRNEYNKRVRQEKYSFIVNIKLNKGCQNPYCSYVITNPSQLCFHHINESEKLFSISKFGTLKTTDKLLAEINKCIVLCSNCHNDFHYGDLVIENITKPTMKVGNLDRKLSKNNLYIKNYKTYNNICCMCKNKYNYYNLQFHHQECKDFQISRASRKSLEEIKSEIKKCILICTNCHESFK